MYAYNCLFLAVHWSSIGGEGVVIDLPMGFRLVFLLLLTSLPAVFVKEVAGATIVVNGTTVVSETDSNFICATIDWWPHDKCSYNYCPWGLTSAINLVRIFYDMICFLI